MMIVNERKVGGVTVIDFKGDADKRGHYDEFRQLLHSRMADGQRFFVLNLADCTRLDSMGVGELIRAMLHVTRKDGSLKLACIPQKVKNLLSTTNLGQLFESFDDEASAIKSFE
jgi:anti-anti-sigma factor